MSKAETELRSPKTRGEIHTLQYGRGVAALLVCLFHQEGLSAKYFGQLGADGWFFAGRSGVEFFFILSGFIIFTIHRSDIGAPAKLRPYLVKRLIRLFPIFWLIAVPIGLAMLLNANLGENRQLTPLKFIMDLLLIPRSGVLTVPPAWTLEHEIVFYLVFSVAILNSRIGFALLALWQVACLAALSFNLIPVGFQNLQPMARLVGYANLGFAIGMAIAYFYARVDFGRYRPALLSLGALGTIALLAAIFLEGRSAGVLAPNAAVESFAFFAIYALVMIGLLAIPNIRRPLLDATLGVLGAASYSLYLVHEAAGSFFFKIMDIAAIRPLLTAHLAYAISIVLTVALALAIHLRIERPFLAWLRRQFLPSHQRTSKEPTPVALAEAPRSI